MQCPIAGRRGHIDEISLGLAPIIVERLFYSVAETDAEGRTIVLVEPDVKPVTAEEQLTDCAICTEGENL